MDSETENRDKWLSDMADDHEHNQRRFESLERRVRAVEKRGALLPDFDQENIFFYLTLAYVLFGFVLPAVFRLFGGEDSE